MEGLHIFLFVTTVLNPEFRYFARIFVSSDRLAFGWVENTAQEGFKSHITEDSDRSHTYIHD